MLALVQNGWPTIKVGTTDWASDACPTTLSSRWPTVKVGTTEWASDACPSTGADQAAEVSAAASNAPAARATVMCMPKAAYVTASETGDAAAANVSANPASAGRNRASAPANPFSAQSHPGLRTARTAIASCLWHQRRSIRRRENRAASAPATIYGSAARTIDAQSASAPENERSTSGGDQTHAQTSAIATIA